jgi:hypothetical protein
MVAGPRTNMDTRAANIRRTALVLLSIALVFFFGIMVKVLLIGK